MREDGPPRFSSSVPFCQFVSLFFDPIREDGGREERRPRGHVVQAPEARIEARIQKYSAMGAFEEIAFSAVTDKE